MSKKLLSVVLSFLFLLSTPFIASATNTDKLNSTTNSNVKTSLLRDTYLSDKEIFEITKSLEQSKDPSILSKYGIDGDDGVFLIYANQNDNSTISNDTTVSPNAIVVGFGTLKCTASGMTQFATLNYRLYGDKMTYINATITYILKDPEIGDVWAGEDILSYEIPSFSTIRDQYDETQTIEGYYCAEIEGTVTGYNGVYTLSALGQSNKVYLHY